MTSLAALEAQTSEHVLCIWSYHLVRTSSTGTDAMAELSEMDVAKGESSWIWRWKMTLAPAGGNFVQRLWSCKRRTPGTESVLSSFVQYTESQNVAQVRDCGGRSAGQRFVCCLEPRLATHHDRPRSARPTELLIVIKLRWTFAHSNPRLIAAWDKCFANPPLRSCPTRYRFRLGARLALCHLPKLLKSAH